MVSKEQLLEKEVEVLRNEISILDDRLRVLIKMVAPKLRVPEEWDIPHREKQVLQALYGAEVSINAEQLHAIYMNDVSVKGNDILTYQVWESHVSKLRKKLKKINLPIEIKSRRFEGYWLTIDSKVYLKQFVANFEEYNV